MVLRLKAFQKSKKKYEIILFVSLTVIPIKSVKKTGMFDLFKTINESIKNNQQCLEDGDIIVISSKFVSHSQGRLIDYNLVVPSQNARNIAGRYLIQPQICEVILRESDKIFGGVPGFIITSTKKILAPNAGIDKSNAKGKLILYPHESYKIAENLKRKIFLEESIHVGIIIVDSRLMPVRVGTVGVAIACAGFEPVTDMRTKKDLDENPLKVTFKATADNLASIANFKMGEGNESQPIAIVRNSGVKMTDRKIIDDEMVVPNDECVYIRGLSGN